MIVEAALRVAGDNAHLVTRPGGRIHVYVGPLTPCGYVPRRRSPMCRARTRRLTTVNLLRRGWSSLSPESSLPVLCARCSALLSGVATSRAEQHPRTRTEFLTRFADVTPFDLVLAAKAACKPEEIDQVAHLSLVLFGHAGCTQPVPYPDGRGVTPALHQLLIRHRRRVDGFPPDLAVAATRHDELSAAAAEQRKRERKADRQQREAAYQATRAPRVEPKEPAL